MFSINQATQKSTAFSSVSLIESSINEPRKAFSPLNCKSLIWYADMWFNLRGDPRFDLKISDEVKWQLYFAATAHIDATGIIQKGYFSPDHLQIDELVLLYRRKNSRNTKNFEGTHGC